MQFHPFEIFLSAIWSSPLWVKAVFMLLIVVRVGWPSLLTERARRRRRRWRRHWDD